MGGRRGVCRDNLAFRLCISAAAILGAIFGASAVAGTVVAVGLGAALADVQIAVAVAADGWD